MPRAFGDVIGREAPLIAVFPSQNFWKPLPVPVPSMRMSVTRREAYNASTDLLMGSTVLEPSTSTGFSSGLGLALSNFTAGVFSGGD